MPEAVRGNSTPVPNSRPASPLMGISRDRLSEAIERLIAVLDALDGDTDLEDGGDAEPYLAQIGQRWHGSDDDREADGDMPGGNVIPLRAGRARR